MTELTPIHFYDDSIEVIFEVSSAHEKTLDCPNGFIWNDQTYHVIEMLSSWSDFTCRRRAARNIRPAYVEVASTHGSLNVGWFYFCVIAATGQTFELYYDRAMKNVAERKGQWFVYRELAISL